MREQSDVSNRARSSLDVSHQRIASIPRNVADFVNENASSCWRVDLRDIDPLKLEDRRRVSARCGIKRCRNNTRNTTTKYYGEFTTTRPQGNACTRISITPNDLLKKNCPG